MPTKLMFQSAPGLTVGRCAGRAPPKCSARPCFNPRPASRSGDATRERRRLRSCSVSIRARPHGRAMLSVGTRAPALLEVSIRARPHGRAMLRDLYPCPSTDQFQSAPGLTVGRCLERAARELACDFVSIRARPHGRAMPGRLGAHSPHCLFQSAPGLTVGRCKCAPHGDCASFLFQSAPGLTVGRCLGKCQTWFFLSEVSIRARPHGRAMRAPRVPVRPDGAVSIRARPHGRAMPEV